MSKLAHLQRFLPGERTRMMLITAAIGLMAGLVIIAFREIMELVKTIILHHGASLLNIDQGSWRRALLPLLPMVGAALAVDRKSVV